MIVKIVDESQGLFPDFFVFINIRKKRCKMIYFKNEILRFPKHFQQSTTKMVITNDLTGDVYEYNLEDKSDDDRYYEFDFTDIELKNGTYTYRMGDEVGLIQVGDYVETTNTYDKKNINVVYER